VTEAGKPGPHNGLTDVAGLRVGHHTAVGDGFLTGTTVILAPDGGMTAGVDVRGGGPATHESDLLDPTASVQRIHAIVLTGGSAFGLATCSAVMDELAADGVGLQVGPDPAAVVPLVPGAALFDLGRGGDFSARPNRDFGIAALADARRGGDGPVVEGSVGAGTGAVISNLKGGIGSASVVTGSGFTVAALVAVNAAGSPIDPATGELLGARLLHPADGPAPVLPDGAGRDALLAATAPRPPGIAFGGANSDEVDPDAAAITNTTLAVVATDAALTKAECTKMAQVAQDGLTRAINPVHTMFDGDTIFGAATGTAGPPETVALFEITAAAADVLSRAIVRAVLAARTTSTTVDRWPSWSDVAASRSG
jgi:L-aminopeptidase/D-esterase-like protein